MNHTASSIACSAKRSKQLASCYATALSAGRGIVCPVKLKDVYIRLFLIANTEWAVLSLQKEISRD